jgi:uncharacterized protein YaiE (UPF0345 family)
MPDSAPTTLGPVEVDTKANVYFDGKVVSHTVRFADGTRKTLGLIFPGSFHFGTAAAEIMQIVAGTCRVRIGAEPMFTKFGPGSRFEVPADSGFDIAVDDGLVEYVCSFV